MESCLTKNRLAGVPARQLANVKAPLCRRGVWGEAFI